MTLSKKTMIEKIKTPRKNRSARDQTPSQRLSRSERVLLLWFIMKRRLQKDQLQQSRMKNQLELEPTQNSPRSLILTREKMNCTPRAAPTSFRKEEKQHPILMKNTTPALTKSTRMPTMRKTMKTSSTQSPILMAIPWN